MPVQLNGETLLDGRELANLLGVALKTTINYHQAARDRGYPEGPGKFPRPFITVSGHHLWRQEDAEEYAKNRPSALRATEAAR